MGLGGYQKESPELSLGILPKPWRGRLRCSVLVMHHQAVGMEMNMFGSGSKTYLDLR
jgi:hypothetical protein